MAYPLIWMSFLMDWYPEAPLAAFQACRRLLFFSEKQHAFFKKSVSVNMCEHLMFLRTIEKHKIEAERNFM